ncbi:hypothetical protein RB594_004930 [Gaeumannomyces avenae]
MASEPPQFPELSPYQQDKNNNHKQNHQRSGSMSLGAPPGTAGSENDGSVSGAPQPQPSTAPAPDAAGAETERQVQEVLQSEVGISTLLTRLKQSISSTKEFALFLKKRAILEEDLAAGLRKLCKMSQSTMLHPDHRQGTFAEAYSGMMGVHDKMAQNGLQFSSSLHQMHDDLVELYTYAEKNRKGWKQNGLSAEQRVADIEASVRKSKAKYDALAEDYDRVRTGDSQKGGKMFGFKGPKSAAQHEEDLLRKVQGADQDYHSRVDLLQAERAELMRTTRPEAIKALQDTIRECDAGLTLQIQKFASFNEKLLLSNGLSISPLKKDAETKSLRDMVAGINNDRDISDFVVSHYRNVPPRTGEPKYERHAVLGGPSHAGPTSLQPPGQVPYGPPSAQFSMASQQFPGPLSQGALGSTFASPMGPGPAMGGPPSKGHERNFSHTSLLSNTSLPSQSGNPPPLQQQNQQHQQQPPPPPPPPPQQQQQHHQQQQYGPRNGQDSGPAYGPTPSQKPPQLGALPFQQAPPQQGPPGGHHGHPNPLMQHQPAGADRPGSGGFPQGRNHSPPQAPTRPVFGVSLARLYERDSLAVPQVVYQCITAVDFYGLTVEGIYRLSGSVPHVNKLKSMFDSNSDSPNLDFRNPESFFHDVNSVAGLLKQFLRDLPDPLLTREHYTAFIEAAKSDDEVVRRDSLHAIINNLPDPNYATLRALTLHLHRVMDNSHTNRMNSQNLAIVFGPTLMGTGANSDISDAGWQVRVVDTILQNTLQIFDED